MINRIISYITRIGKSRGFGIQSPWAYDIVRNVIMSKDPYYAYEEIDQAALRKPLLKQIGRSGTAFAKLYFRLVNLVQPKDFIDLTDTAEQVLPLMQLARRDMAVHSSLNTYTASEESQNVVDEQVPTVLRLSLRSADMSMIERLAGHSLIIIEDIDTHQAKWERIKQSPAIRCTFDLYYTAICFPPSAKRDKQHYRLNFS